MTKKRERTKQGAGLFLGEYDEDEAFMLAYERHEWLIKERERKKRRLPRISA